MIETHTCTPGERCYACDVERYNRSNPVNEQRITLLEKRIKELEDMVQQSDKKCWLISMKKSLVWWKEAAQGYSLNILEAGLYTYKEMIDITKGDDENRQGVHLLTKKTEIDAALEKLERETSETVMKWKKALGVAND